MTEWAGGTATAMHEATAGELPAGSVTLSGLNCIN